MDNNDEKHDTKDGSLSTHDTNRALFFNVLENEDPKVYQRSIHDLKECPREEPFSGPSYHHSSRKDPTRIMKFDYDCNTDKVSMSFKNDILWALLDAVLSEPDSNKSRKVGSSTSFKKQTTDRNQNKTVIQFEPVIPSPPNFSVCKGHLDHLNKVADELGLDFVIVHAAQDVFLKILQIIWNHPTLYTRIHPLTGGFREIKVMHHLLFKRY